MVNLKEINACLSLIYNDMYALLESDKHVYPPYIKDDLRSCVKNRLSDLLNKGIELSIMTIGSMNLIVIYISKPNGESFFDLSDEDVGKDNIHILLDQKKEAINEKFLGVLQKHDGKKIYGDTSDLKKLKGGVRKLIYYLMGKTAYGLISGELANCNRAERRLQIGLQKSMKQK